jgi:hypothetical protein
LYQEFLYDNTNVTPNMAIRRVQLPLRIKKVPASIFGWFN